MAKLSIDLSSAIIIDTGCTQHMFRSRELFITYRDLRADENIIISGIGGTCLQSIGKGDVCLRLTVLGIERELILTNVLYVPDLQANLLSGSQLIDNRVHLHLSDLGCDFLYNSELIAHAFRKSGSSFSTLGLTIRKGLQPLQLTIKSAICHTAAHKTQPKGCGTKGLVTLALRTYENFKECQKG